MPIMVDEGEKKEYILVPAATHQAVCYNVWDLGWQMVDFGQGKKIVGQLIIGWEVNEIIPAGEFQGKRFTISKKYTKSLFEKANLCKDLESWRGKAFTDGERKGFDVEKLIGVNCLLSVVHKTSKKGNVYAVVGGVMKLPKGSMPVKPENERTTPDWIKELILTQVENPEVNDHQEPEVSDDTEEEIPF